MGGSTDAARLVTDDELGDVIGDVVGDVTGDVVGDVIGDIIGDIIGDVVGDVIGDVVGDVVGDVIGDATDDVVGDVTGDVVGDDFDDVTGDVVGDVVGDIVGDDFGDAIRDVIGGEIGEDRGRSPGWAKKTNQSVIFGRFRVLHLVGNEPPMNTAGEPKIRSQGTSDARRTAWRERVRYGCRFVGGLMLISVLCWFRIGLQRLVRRRFPGSTRRLSQNRL